TLKKGERDGRLITVTIDEYNSSKTFSGWHHKTLKTVRHICGQYSWIHIL
ncbi:hypothetical protein J3Q64DRAFT_1638965, partial [Phycomyces blakesleeanus]